MGGIITTIRDVKVILRDLKITLKFTAKIVLKVHGIVDDMEQTMQELKETVNGLSSRLPNTSKENSVDEATTSYVKEVVQTIESKAESMKASLSNAVTVLSSDDMMKNTSNAWENLISHKTVTEMMSKWASVPEGIGELVKQDCERLIECVNSGDHGPIQEATEAIKPDIAETNFAGKLHTEVVCSIEKPSMEICKLISNNTTPNTVHLLKKDPPINECFVPEIVIEDILNQRIDAERFMKCFGPLETFKVKYNPQLLAAILKTSPVLQMTMKHKMNHKMNNSLSKNNETDDMITPGDFQTDILSLLFVNLLQGFLENETIIFGADNDNRYLADD